MSDKHCIQHILNDHTYDFIIDGVHYWSSYQYCIAKLARAHFSKKTLDAVLNCKVYTVLDSCIFDELYMYVHFNIETYVDIFHARCERHPSLKDLLLEVDIDSLCIRTMSEYNALTAVRNKFLNYKPK